MSVESGRAAAPDVPGYSVGHEIGKGSFAVVYLGRPLKGDDRSVAIKSVARSKLTKKLLENLESEISILKGIRHAHIVSLLDKTENETQIHLIMEFCPLGDLSVFIKRRDKPVGSESTAYVHDLMAQYPSTPGAGLHQVLVRHFLQQLGAALFFLRSQNLMHRDVKPQNLLLAPPESPTHIAAGLAALPVLKLADFGFARYLQTSSLAETLCGSPLYMAPEILQYERYDATADLWSTGTVLYEMLIGKPPYRAANHVELLRKIVRSEDVIRFPSDVPLAEDLKDLIRSLLKRNPRQRLSFDNFFASDVLTKPLQNAALPGLSQPVELDERLATIELRGQSARSADTRRRTKLAENGPGQEPTEPTLAARGVDVATDAPFERTQEEPLGHHLNPVTRREVPARQDAGRPRSLDSGRSVNDGDRDSDGDYVVVEKKTVELNAFADAVSRPIATRAPSGSRRHDSHRVVMQGEHTKNVAQPISKPMQLPSDRASPRGTQTGALARALSIASQRLFGSASPPKWLDNVIKNSNRPLLALYGRSMAIGEMAEILQHSDEPSSRAESQLVNNVGRIAMRATIVYDFAELKLAQLVTIPPGMHSSEPTSMLTSEAVASISQEAILLYLKALQLLHGVIDSVRDWLARQAASAPIGSRLSRLVQWTREKYNEALEKGEALQQRKGARNMEHETSQAVEEATVERLLFDRALDLVRAAALNEMTGDDLVQCEDDYEVAILMLEALLDDSGRDGSPYATTRQSDTRGRVDPGVDELGSDDRQLIERWLALTRQRHDKLRLKMESILTRSGYVTGSLEPEGLRTHHALPSHSEALAIS